MSEPLGPCARFDAASSAAETGEEASKALEALTRETVGVKSFAVVTLDIRTYAAALSGLGSQADEDEGVDSRWMVRAPNRSEWSGGLNELPPGGIVPKGVAGGLDHIVSDDCAKGHAAACGGAHAGRPVPGIQGGSGGQARPSALRRHSRISNKESAPSRPMPTSTRSPIAA